MLTKNQQHLKYLGVVAPTSATILEENKQEPESERLKREVIDVVNFEKILLKI